MPRGAEEDEQVETGTGSGASQGPGRTEGLDGRIARVIAELDRAGVAYELVFHEPVFTAEEAQVVKEKVAGHGCRTLFLVTAREDRVFLVLAGDEKRADLRALARGLGTSRLSFGRPELLSELTGLVPGSVSPFGLLNDDGGRVELVVDGDLLPDRILVHPNLNTATVALNCRDLVDFFRARGRVVRVWEH